MGKVRQRERRTKSRVNFISFDLSAVSTQRIHPTEACEATAVCRGDACGTLCGIKGGSLSLIVGGTEVNLYDVSE